MLEFKLPDLGEGVTEGELVQWLVKVGDSVSVDQPLAEVMTDKATVEVPSPSKGVVKEIKSKPGDIIKVGAVLLTLDTAAGGSASAAPAKESAAPAKQEKPTPAVAAAPQASKSSNGSYTNGSPAQNAIQPPVMQSHVLASPGTRRLARESNVDINSLKGSGPVGRVTREDVSAAGGGGGLETYAPGKTSIIPRTPFVGMGGELETREPIRGIRRKIAEKMQLSKHVIPHFTIMDEVNVTELVNTREKLKPKMEQTGIKITYLPFVIKALIATMREFPKFNASIDDDKQEIVYKKYYNIGFAADTDNGLVVPVIKNADFKSVLQISQEIIELSKKARANKLAPDDMKGSCITVTNIGSVGGTYATPIINHPEVAIIGMYKIQDKPVIEDGKLKAIKVMNFTVTADHRLIDGAEAARFLKAFSERIENPGVLMLDLM